MSNKIKGIQRPTSRVEIRYDNAKNYIPDLDRPYFVTDSIQSHLKLRVMQQGSKTFFYDYMWNGTRCRQRLGTLSDNNKDGITPSEARKLVGSYEVRRKGNVSKTAQSTEYRIFRVEVDGRQLIFIDHTGVDDIHALMVQRFGAARIGLLQEINHVR